MNILPGSPHPLGATWDGEGVNFALYSENATGIDLCLFDEQGQETRLPLRECTAFVWHIYVGGVQPGQRYGYRVHGPYEPQRGLRFNANMVLLDPYARALSGPENWENGCFAYVLGGPDGDLRASDEAGLGVPRGVVIDPAFDWEGDVAPRTPLHRSLIYEAHVKGLTKLHPEVPEELRGTYAGVAHPAVVEHLRSLGVTAIELMPVHAFIDDKVLLDRGLRNYWGYNTVNFFAPDARYRAGHEIGCEVREFKSMVKALHRAGIEVILDVVYNHTAEGNHLGPTFNFKGIDNPTYYRLVHGDPRHYYDYTGTGNTLNVRHPQVLALIMDSLRYWATEMHVDGFRFDLASALARQLHEVDQLSSFFTLIHQSPLLRELKLIAEPWDVGEGGYQVGNFPVRWAEWNGRYRDSVRALWRGDRGQASEIGYRLTGSSDLYERGGRRPSASVNLITAHDGFTLRDLVSYDHKHNHANGEDNRDGNDHEHSWNCGVEGETTDANILALRRRQQLNLLATLLLSQGTPMLVAGDELSRTQGGNNNAYCQDNEVSWIDWDLSIEQQTFLASVRRILRVRREHPALQRAKFFQGRDIHTSLAGGSARLDEGTSLQDLLWFRHDGQPMGQEDWENPGTSSFVMFLAGRGIDDVDEQGRPIVDDDLLLLLNASDIDIEFTIPSVGGRHEPFDMLIDTADENAVESLRAGQRTHVIARSLKFMRAPSRVHRTGGLLHTLGSTYRLQLHAEFGFRSAIKVVDYLADLGVTDVYLSPIFAATPGSMHGYDVVDHAKLNPELGTEQDFEALTQALAQREMGLLLDWVPNHMGIASHRNKLWDDVLENGQSSRYEAFFDIDWARPREDLRNRLLLPILGDQYGAVLERGELQLCWDDGQLRVCYFDRRLPIDPKTLSIVFKAILGKLPRDTSEQVRWELESLLSATQHLPDRTVNTEPERYERAREKDVILRRFAHLHGGSEAARQALEEALRELNGTPGVASTFDALDELLRAQPYRLASWRVAGEEINYRRFFDINDLAAIRMEVPHVLEETHAALFRLLSDGKIQALRLDHTDGLYDPAGYFEALQRALRGSHPGPQLNRSPDDQARPLPILVEKILAPEEQIPSTWQVDGTTGYEFARAVRGLWVNASAEGALSEIYASYTGDEQTFGEHVYESKYHVLRFSFSSEVGMLARALHRIASQNRRTRDFTLKGISHALTETLACFAVYRTYLREGDGVGREDDEAQIRAAIARARQRQPELSASMFTFLEDVLVMSPSLVAANQPGEVASVALRFQQLTGPVTAKAVEDTAFYRYHRLVSLNEVGSDPGLFGVSIAEFHRENMIRMRSWPLSMLAGSTHDSKRGEDTAARISVISEVPKLWRTLLREVRPMVQRIRARLGETGAPSLSVEYLFLQTLVGVWPYGWDGQDGRPQLTRRLVEYLLKAEREAKRMTSWLAPNGNYERGLLEFVEAMMADEAFLRLMRAFCERIAPHAAVNGLAQTLLRICSVGVPDTYQGTELWQQTLVDPDNRQSVDFDARRRALSRIKEGLTDRRRVARELMARFQTGEVKLYLIHTALAARRDHVDLFRAGEYLALDGGEHCVAFALTAGERRLICAVPRWTCLQSQEAAERGAGPGWADVKLAGVMPGTYTNLLTGVRSDLQGEVALADVFADFPVALLLREAP